MEKIYSLLHFHQRRKNEYKLALFIDLSISYFEGSADPYLTLKSGLTEHILGAIRNEQTRFSVSQASLYIFRVVNLTY